MNEITTDKKGRGKSIYLEDGEIDVIMKTRKQMGWDQDLQEHIQLELKIEYLHH